MDQGIAAAFAAVTALIGAGIGALATAYTARKGPRTQVQHQSAAEHTHWVREQRKQACNDAADAWAPFAEELVACTEKIHRGEAVAQETLDALHRSIVDLNDRCTRLQLWGPDELLEAAVNLVQTAMTARASARAWQQALEEGDQDVIETWQTEHAGIALQVGSAWAVFMDVARTTLGSPPS
ncbi:hypothetical protein ACIG63_06555 [Streptomyces antimycoticus]|uniref:hypothetical protein n=1 Tax=Streptomyces antimycoticus TaxID=68175 RepID=UPI0037D2C456